MTPLPTWMRGALWATGVMNIGAAAAFAPPAGAVRTLMGFPQADHPLYLGMVTIFVALFGLGYLWSAVSGRGDRMFITLAAVGKVSFVVLLLWFWAAGALPARAPLAGMADLIFAGLFVRWLLGSDQAPAVTVSAFNR